MIDHEDKSIYKSYVYFVCYTLHFNCTLQCSSCVDIFYMESYLSFTRITCDRSTLSKIKIIYISPKWYHFASLFQASLTMIFILVSIIDLLISICLIKKVENTWKEYQLFSFSFELLCGSIITTFVVNINVVVVSFKAVVSTKVAFAISSLGCFYIVAFIAIFVRKILHLCFHW